MLSGSGCRRQPIEAVPAWTKHSLESGPNVRVRLIRKKYFDNAYIDGISDGVILQNAKGEAIPIPKGTHRVYFKMKKNRVVVAFNRHKAAFEKAERYQQVWVRIRNNKIKIFKVHIPSQRFICDYEANILDISIKYGRMAIINHLPMEMYLARVIPEEMDPENFTLEALKAQAVVARTWALKNLKRHNRYGYDYCDGPHCQVYKGRKQVSRRAEQAVKMTLGEVITYNHRLAEAFYHSTCGGNTVYVDEVWANRRIPYLMRVEDRWKPGNRPYCSQSPYAQWRVRLSLRRVERALVKAKIIAKQEKLITASVDFINRSGRVLKVRIKTDEQEVFMTGYQFRRAINREFGRRKMFSDFYRLETDGNQFRAVGNGLGHGVGLCQWGARGMAQHGFGYAEILLHYFNGTQLGGNYGLASDTPSDVESTTQNSHAEIK
ncbi:SpoIID/LytB domain-containing protein [bacterium]|nr:SpoIID/LytB domain-containing protein [bacterium]